jgi:hypothetical protein
VTTIDDDTTDTEPGGWDWRGEVLTSGRRRHAHLVLPGICVALIVVAVVVGVAARAHGSALWMPAAALAAGSWAALIDQIQRLRSRE